ncbi:MAG TPA: lysine 2,3-aminomutase [Thermoanaerobaculia bacterium]|nr:lysine 2,3-aminomutase [Thermoanaerobaculia bacterium]
MSERGAAMPAAEPAFRAIAASNIAATPLWGRLSAELREAVLVVSQVLPFRTNLYVAELIDWRKVPDDPIFQLTFPQREMLDEDDYQAIRDLLKQRAPAPAIAALADRIRRRMNPHPGGQMEYNVPQLDGLALPGLQHKYAETVLFFPSQGQTCHAYCTYCFRWAQFVDLPDLRFSAAESDDLVAYLRAHREVTDVLITGGDPLIMNARLLRRYVEPLLAADLDHVRSIRLGTKAPAYWPQRLVSDPDADDLLRLFEEVVAAGRHLAMMVHFSHPVELSTDLARDCIRRLRGTGAEIRLQAPVVRHVNDSAAIWRELCSQSVQMGMTPYYMFVARDTGPRKYFELPLEEVYAIYIAAYRQLSGLARALRGPIMSTTEGKVRLLGSASVGGREVFVLDFLQARDPAWVGRPFFAEKDANATWFDELRPASPADAPFFDLAPAQAPVAAS